MVWEYIVSECHVCKTPVFVDDSIRISKEEWIFPRYYCEKCCGAKNAKEEKS